VREWDRAVGLILAAATGGDLLAVVEQFERILIHKNKIILHDLASVTSQGRRVGAPRLNAATRSCEKTTEGGRLLQRVEVAVLARKRFVQKEAE
jgi:hypothetical protein